MEIWKITLMGLGLIVAFRKEILCYILDFLLFLAYLAGKRTIKKIKDVKDFKEVEKEILEFEDLVDDVIKMKGKILGYDEKS